MSFFDETDEPPRTEIRRPSRPSARRRTSGSGSGGSGGGSRRRPPGGSEHQSILVRRGVAVVALVIVVILIAVGVNSCQSSARKSALRDYANSVSGVITKSSNTSSSLFTALKGSSGGATSVSNSIDQTEASANTVLKQAEGLSVPSAAKTAHSHLVLALQMRLDGITAIAGEIQSALGKSVGKQAVDDIATQMARFYASDVLYKDYTVPELVAALHANGIAVGASDNGTPVNGSQFLPSLSWLTPTYIASRLGVSLGSSSSSSGSSGTVTGLHGDALNSVSVAGTTLTSGASMSASPAPTFDLSVTNGGHFTENDVTCKVSVTGTSATGTKIIPQVAAGATETCAVTLTSAPPTGTNTVVATVEKVPGEKNLSNNTLSYPVTFK